MYYGINASLSDSVGSIRQTHASVMANESAYPGPYV